MKQKKNKVEMFWDSGIKCEAHVHFPYRLRTFAFQRLNWSIFDFGSGLKQREMTKSAQNKYTQWEQNKTRFNNGQRNEVVVLVFFSIPSLLSLQIHEIFSAQLNFYGT